jgi:hypothetical protein
MRKLLILGIALSALVPTAVAWSSRGGSAATVHHHQHATTTAVPTS